MCVIDRLIQAYVLHVTLIHKYKHSSLTADRLTLPQCNRLHLLTTERNMMQKVYSIGSIMTAKPFIDDFLS